MNSEQYKDRTEQSATPFPLPPPKKKGGAGETTTKTSAVACGRYSDTYYASAHVHLLTVPFYYTL